MIDFEGGGILVTDGGSGPRVGESLKLGGRDLTKTAAVEYAARGLRVGSVGSLLSNRARLFTGSYHLVDGGFTARYDRQSSNTTE